MRNPKFTDDELIFIEKIMDIEASLCGQRLQRTCETFMLMQMKEGNEEAKKMMGNEICEIGRSQIILESIRSKIEKWRKQ